jgi:PAS domain S-box-containing protein
LEVEKYKALFDKSPVPTLYVISEKVETVNRAAAKLFKRLGLDDPKGADFGKIWPGGTKASREGAIIDLGSLKPGRFDLTLPDGSGYAADVTLLEGEPPANAIITIADGTGLIPFAETPSESEMDPDSPSGGAGYGVVIVQDSIIKYVDPSVARMCGRTVGEMPGTVFSNYVEPLVEPLRINDDYNRSKGGGYVASTYEAIIRRKDGENVYVEVNEVVISYKGRNADLMFVRDINERKVNETAMEREREAFRLIAEASAQFKVVPDLCRKVLSGLVNILGFEYGFIRLYDAGTRILYPTITVGLGEKDVKKLMGRRSLDDPELLSAFVARTRRAVFAPDSRVIRTLQTRTSGFKEFGAGSLICWPVLGADQKLLGVMQLGSCTPKDMPDEDRIFFETVAGMFSAVLENGRAGETASDKERTYRGLYNAVLAVGAEKGLDDIIRVVADGVQDLLDAVNAVVYLIDRDRGVLVPVYTGDVKTREAILASEIPTGEGFFGRVAATGAGTYVNIGGRDDHAVNILCTGRDENESVIAAPMFDGDDVFGLISAVKTGGLFADDDLENLTLFARQAEVAVKRARDLDSLRESEEKFRTVFEAAGDSIFIKDAELRYVNVNPAAEHVFGISASEIIGRTDDELFGKEPAARMKEIDYRILSGETTEGEVTLPVNGVPTMLHIIGVPIRDENGVVFRVCGVVRDITKRKKDEERVKKSLKEKELLLEETHHRVKNNLQIISSLLDLQAGYAKDEKLHDIFRDSQKRIQSMALIHEKFYRAEDFIGVDFSGYVNDLILSLFSTYRFDTSAVDLQTNIGEVSLDIDTSVPLALIINELISNSLEHAFPDGGSGRIRVDLREESDDVFKLTVADNGVGLPEGFNIQNTESLGLGLVGALAEQLGGTIEIDTTGGTRFDITFPSKRRNEN